jgi:hypothetical protein
MRLTLLQGIGEIESALIGILKRYFVRLGRKNFLQKRLHY